MISETISHYRIIKKLGAGGMGEVYLAEDTRLDRKVAIKFLSPESVADEQAQKRLLREAKAAAKLDHPNICAIHEIAEVDSRSFIVMQLIEGATLARRMQHKLIDLKEALDIAAQVADALSEAHSRGIIHRDIKPQNIMLTVRGQAKVMDFGLAKMVCEGERLESEAVTESLLTEPGAIVGTLPYMSPEQVRGELLDARSDIFSFGTMLYEMLSGHRPFSKESATATISAILTHDPLPLGRYVDAMPTELERIVRKCLGKDRERRYQTIREVAIDLEQVRREYETDAVTGGRDKQLAASAAEVRSGRAKIILPYASRRALMMSLALAMLLGTGLAYVFLFHKTSTTGLPPEIKSLAVLPLENLSGDPAQDYFADGMTEAITANLAQIRALKVVSRTSVMRFKGSRKSLPEIAAELKVDAVIEGSVQRASGRVKITAQLIHAATDAHLWARDYERDLADILQLQGEVARAVADEIRIQVTPEERARLGAARRVNPEAHEAYLLGLYHWNKRTEVGLKKGITYFQQAVEKDPNYALAYAGLAECHHVLAGIEYQNPEEFYPKGKAYAEKALSLDGTLAEARATLASVKAWFEWDFPGAEQEFKRAIALDPSYPTAHQRFGLLLMNMGRTAESFAEYRRALELDPISVSINSGLGWNLYFAREYDRASEQLRKTLELDPISPNAHIYLGQVYTQQGKYAEAIAELTKAAESSRSRAVARLGYTYAHSGDKDKAQQVLAELQEMAKQRYVSPLDFATIYAGLGDKNQAFAWLEKGFQGRAGAMVYIKEEPMFVGLHSDPRWKVLLRRMKFPPE